MGAGSSRFWTRNLDNHSSSDSPREAPGYQSYSPAAPSSYSSPSPLSYAAPPSHSEPYQPQGGQWINRMWRRIDRRFSRISDDHYDTVDNVTDALSRAGLQSANLIVGIDFTKSNEWTGKVSFGRRSLHHIGDMPNPYEQAISIIGRTLSAFDEDNLIPCFGFGDASTHDQDIFSFYPEGRPCNGFPDALQRYREVVPHVRLADPTSFAPVIEMATAIVEQSGGQYHVLVIIADGQVTRSADIQSGHLSSQEQKTIDAIAKASGFPLSIVLVGVGDGPWDTLKEFYDNIPARSFDNFQFVNFTEIMSGDIPQPRKEAAFAHAASMKIPSQYKATLELGILGVENSRRSGESPRRVPLPPPIGGDNASSVSNNSYRSTGFRMSAPLYPEYETTSSAPPAPPNSSLESELTDALSRVGLESLKLIVGIDFTKSNEWTGKVSFGRRSLHHIGDMPNPYEQAISTIGRMSSAFDEDNLIPCFGFGDASTQDQDIFSFYPDGRPCNGFQDALQRYREIVPHLRLAGPTSFAPLIEMAMTIVEQSGGQYHVLVIIADGQVTRSVDTQSGHLSSQEQKTVDAIVKASGFPLSIILVGVGDGPWDTMKEFRDNIPACAFDNFQFVNFTKIMSRSIPQPRKEAAFARAASMEIPSHYKATLELGILGHQSGNSPRRVPLPPPIGGYNALSVSNNSYKSSSFQRSAPLYPEYEATSSAPPAPPNSSLESQVCPICLTNPRDMAFGCGHLTCSECGPSLQTCPICRREISTRIKLY